MESIKYPATHIVYWATGPVACCGKHAAALITLARALGYTCALSIGPGDKECINCVNESQQKED